jgi:hypothetical protein
MRKQYGAGRRDGDRPRQYLEVLTHHYSGKQRKGVVPIQGGGGLDEAHCKRDREARSRADADGAPLVTRCSWSG